MAFYDTVKFDEFAKSPIHQVLGVKFYVAVHRFRVRDKNATLNP